MFVNILTNKYYYLTYMTNEFTLSFPAIRAVQARREYYVIMCPLKHISKIFTFDDVELSPEIRAFKG